VSFNPTWFNLSFGKSVFKNSKIGTSLPQADDVFKNEKNDIFCRKFIYFFTEQIGGKAKNSTRAPKT